MLMKIIIAKNGALPFVFRTALILCGKVLKTPLWARSHCNLRYRPRFFYCMHTHAFAFYTLLFLCNVKLNKVF